MGRIVQGQSTVVAELFERAEALEDLAVQAGGDHAERLYERARQAHATGEREQATTEQIAVALEEGAEDREDAVRPATCRARA